MPLTYVPIYVQSIAWNGHTYTSSSGGPIQAGYTHSGTPVADRTGDDQYNTFLAMVDKVCGASFTIRDNVFTDAPGAGPSDCVFTFTGKSSKTVTLLSMVLESVDGDQQRAQPGTAVVKLMHVSADGTTSPVS